MRYRAMTLARALCIGVSMLSVSASAGAALCFAPLADRNSQDPDDWKELRFDPTDPAHPKTKAPGVKRFLPIAKGLNDRLNLDYYEMQFNKPAGASVSAYFKALRQSFGTLSKDQSNDYDFHPYRRSKKADDADLVRECGALGQDTAHRRLDVVSTDGYHLCKGI